MSEGLAVFLWGVGLGGLLANSLGWWRSRAPTQEHLVGAKIIEAGKDVLFTRRVSGDGVRIRNLSVLRIGQEHVMIAVSDAEKADVA